MYLINLSKFQIISLHLLHFMTKKRFSYNSGQLLYMQTAGGAEVVLSVGVWFCPLTSATVLNIFEYVAMSLLGGNHHISQSVPSF